MKLVMTHIQKQKWLKLLKFVNKKSPYYSNIIKHINKPLELIVPQDFPVLTKKIIQEHFNEIVTDSKINQSEVHNHVESHDPTQLYLGKYHILKTSGSSGKPGYFLSSSTEVIEGVAPTVARGHKGIRRRKKRISMIGFPRSYAGSSQTMSFCDKIWIAKKFVEYHPVSIEQPFENVISQLNEIQPHVLSGYAKLLLLLADAQASGKLKIHPDSIESGGELLLNTDRNYLKEVFKCPVNNHYGSTEGFSMGICRDNESGIELFEDHLIFEILPTETRITNLNNFVMPLINYQMRDILVPKGISKTSPFQIVENAIGRTDEIPYLTTLEKDKITIHPLAFDPLMPHGVKTFSMVCDKPNSVTYKIFIDHNHKHLSSNIQAETLKVLKDFFNKKGLSTIEVIVELTDDYDVNLQTGKSQIWRQSVIENTL